MSAIKSRRRRATWMALGGTALAIAAAAALSVVGVDTLADSRAGKLAEGQVDDDLPMQRLPYTPTALVGTVDGTGRLTSLVVMAIEPDGTGGSIVQFAASADANAGNANFLRPLNAVLQAEGPEVFQVDAEAMTGVSFDVVQLIDEQRFTQLVSPLGDLPVNMPIALYDRSSGEQWEVGESMMPGPDAARALTAVDPQIDDWLFEPGRQAVWAGVAERVGAGIGSAVPVASDADLPRITDLDTFVDRLFAGPVEYRALPIAPVDADRIDEELSMDLRTAFGVAAGDPVVVHNRAETLILMGAVAPARVGAPIEAPSFRVVMGFTEDELEAAGVDSMDVLKEAINRLLFLQVNVVSVAELPGSPVPDHSTFEVVDASTVDGVRDSYSVAFGDAIEVVPADTAIESIDIELVLGRDFLQEVGAQVAARVSSSTEDDTAQATSDPSEVDG